MGKIRLLDLETSSKIAAGEVVERPASVIKELVENSIDAGANKITVEIKGGGNVLMRVTDNGSGMSREDAEIAFLRHATSKIKTGADLDAIFTLGFRGEALASVGAVARVSIKTREKGEIEETLVTCEGGEIIASSENAVSEGTVVEVCDLFYNTPARRKFLKKDTTEAGYILDIMERFVLSYPEISFRLINNGKEQLFSQGDGKQVNAVYSVYGKDYAKAMMPVDYKSNNIRVFGLIGKGTLSRPNRNFQSFYVNKRYIKSALLVRALEEAYKNQTMIGKFPVAALNIEINPNNIDINVHPTKLEVKFSDERSVYEALYYAVKSALYSTVNIPEIKKEENHNFKKETGVQVKMPAPPVKPQVKQEPIIKVDLLEAFRKREVPKEIKVSQPEKTFVFTDKKEEVKPQENPVKEDIKKEVPEFKISGQIFSTYIIAEMEDDMLLIDQHAAHERLKYEELKKALEEKKMYPQVLLEPVIVTLNGEEKAQYDKYSDMLFEIGFETEEYGDRDVMIRTAPAEVDWSDAEEMFLELLTQAAEGKKEIITEKYTKMMYTIACKAAIKANHNLSQNEMETLVKNVLMLDNINTCPHGRPIMIKMTKKELEKQFKRIV